MESSTLNDVLLRLVYALEEYKHDKKTTLVLGAGCSLDSTEYDISTMGIMKACLYDHHAVLNDENNWEEVYESFINIVWTGKNTREKRALLNKYFQNMEPTNAHIIIKELIQKGYIHNIITTNFDLLIEESCKNITYLKKVGDEDFEKIGEGEPLFNLLKIHGDLERGKLRFSPSELKQLPNNLEEEINILTKGLTLFLGYRGQDIGLMNSINKTDTASVYWINISGPLNQKHFESEQIKDLLYMRESGENLLYGKEYGDFQKFFQILNQFLILKTHTNIIESTKRHILSNWNGTSIIDMLSINTKIFNIFADILYCSEKTSSENVEKNDKYYTYLNSYLYFFKNIILPSKLITIPHNEIDSLILGLSIEIMARAQSYSIDINEYIDNLKQEFEKKIKDTVLFDNDFWITIKCLLNLNYNCDINVIKFRFKNQYLNIESVEVPINNIKDLMQVIRILSAVNLPYDESNKYKAFSGKNKNLKNIGEKIYIDIGEIESGEKEFISDSFIKKLPGFQMNHNNNKITITSRWLDIIFTIKDEKLYSDESIYDLCLYRCVETTNQFLNFGVKSIEKHVELSLDKDLPDFVSSDKTCMFIVGKSGCGKTSALRHYINMTKDKFFIAVSSKNSNTDKSGLSLFLNMNVDSLDEDLLLKTLNRSFEMNDSILILILDGINEFSFKSQQVNYKKVVELSEKLNRLDCKNIKIIVTCRNYAYFQYKESMGLRLNHLYFYSNIIHNIENTGNEEAAYFLNSFDDKEIGLLSRCYIPENCTITNDITLQNITPLYFSIIGEYISNNKITILDLDNNNGFYETFSKAMLERLSKTNVFFAKMIIYSYFKLVIKYKTINITSFMVENEIVINSGIESLERINETLNELIETNIFVNDSSKSKRIKFSHDKIEEFFFTIFLEESAVLDDILINQIVVLCRQYLIYRSGFIQFLKNKIHDNLGEFKEIITLNSLRNMDVLPRLTIEAISNINKLDRDLSFLLHERDYKKSEILLNVIISGLEDSLFSFSLVTYDLMHIIDSIMHLSNTLIDKDVKSYMYFFKSRLFYFKNDYDSALKNVDEALKLINESNTSLRRKLHVHQAIIWMELGYSKNSIDILQEEYNKCKTNNDIKNKVRIGVELGRSLNHSGQIDAPLVIYEDLLEHEEQITNSYLLARIYGEKANILNKKLFRELKLGFIPVAQLSSEGLQNIEEWFHEAIYLYELSIDLLAKDNDVFCYSGTVPELINTYLNYSMSIKAVGIDKCEKMIKNLDNLFKSITTPYKTDFNLAKAYYFEYKGNILKAIECIETARTCSIRLTNKYKEAKCDVFNSEFAYRRILNSSNKNEISYWKNQANNCIDKAVSYYNEYTKIENNRNLEVCAEMKRLLKTF